MPLTINAGALTRFDNVSFSGFAPEAVQLTVNNPGLVTHFPMNGCRFSTQPTSGQYMQANDTLSDGPTLILDVLGAVPADGSAFTATTGGAIVNWLANPGEANLAVTQTRGAGAGGGGHAAHLHDHRDQRRSGGRDAASSSAPACRSARRASLSTTQGSCTLASGRGRCALGNLPAGSIAVADGVVHLRRRPARSSRPRRCTSATPDSVIANNAHTIAASIVSGGQGVRLR